MADQLVPTVRTPITMPSYAVACVRAWGEVEATAPTREAVGVLWAQFWIETGGRACWNNNIGNVKHVHGDGFDYVALQGVWEGVTPDQASRLIASGQAVPDPSPAHAKAVGAGRVSVILTSGHPGTWFRAYDSLEHATRSHLVFLARKRYASAWPFVLAGKVDLFARELRAKGYFTASAEAYAAGMRPAFAAFCSSRAFDDATDGVEAEPQPDGDQPIIRPRVPLGRPLLDGDDPDDVA